MNTIIRMAIEYKRVVMAALAIILIAGSAAYNNIPKENNPDIPFPFFSVSIIHQGISPEDAERLLIKPVEVELRTLSGIKEMTSFGREGSASIQLEFEPHVDQNKALADVRAAVDRARSKFPADTEEPIIREFNASEFPVMTVVLFGEASDRTLITISRQLRDDLETIPQVLEVDIEGDRQEVLEVIIDSSRLAGYNITQAELFQLISNNNRLVAAGALDTGSGRFSVKLPGIFENAADVMELPVKTSEDGVVTIADIASVRRTFNDQISFARMNGQSAITLDISKRTGTNSIETSENVRRILAASAQAWPTGVQYDVLNDEAIFIRDFLGTLVNSVLSAIVLVAIVVVAALGLRSASIVGVTIPGAFLFGIMLLYFMGYTVNTVVMFGLILSVGLLVDGAIVVSEYADRKMLEGLDKHDAYRMAAQRMAWPIISSTLTTLAAFFPLLFWPDIIGEFMSYLPMTLIFVLLGSLFMALIFLPTLGSIFGRPGAGDARTMEQLSADQELDLKTMKGPTAAYGRLVQKLVARPLYTGLTVAGAFVTLIIVWFAYAMSNPATEFFPSGEPESARLNIHARGNLSPQEMSGLVRDVELRLTDIDGVEDIYSTAGPGSKDIIGRISLEFEDWQKRRPSSEIIAEIRERTDDMAGIVVEPVEQQNGPVSGKDIQIEVNSSIPALLDPVVAELRSYMDSMEGLMDVEDSRPLPGIQWELVVDRAEASRYGTDITSIGSAVQLVTNGIKLGEYRPDDAEDELDIRVRFPVDERGLAHLDNLLITTLQGNIPITNFVERVPRQNVDQIMRLDSERVRTVAANVQDGYFTNERVAVLREWIASQSFDPRVRINFGGSDEQQQASESFLVQALMIAIFLMAIILVTQFNSFYLAGLVLTAVILSTVGVIFGLIVTGKPFVIVMTGVGVIALAGIVVNNNIVLIDTYDRFVRREKIEPIEAIIRTGMQRLRPVMLTTVTTIIGLLPMVFQFNIDFVARDVVVGSPTSFIWVNLAQSIAFGLAFATVLTLLVTPTLLALPVHIKRGWQKRRERRLSGGRRGKSRPIEAGSPAE